MQIKHGDIGLHSVEVATRLVNDNQDTPVTTKEALVHGEVIAHAARGNRV